MELTNVSSEIIRGAGENGSLDRVTGRHFPGSDWVMEAQGIMTNLEEIFNIKKMSGQRAVNPVQLTSR